ncbi:unnamed protein product [Gordionus sp. m RMFG-2023]
MGNKSCCLGKAEDEEYPEKPNNFCNNVKKHSKTFSTINGKNIKGESYSNLQHISEREPEDNLKDPSSNPSAGPLFVSKSKLDLLSLNEKKRDYKNSTRHRSSSSLLPTPFNADTHLSSSFTTASHVRRATSFKPHTIMPNPHGGTIHSSRYYRELRRPSSCSTIYLDDCTASRPHLKMTVKSLALATYYHTRRLESPRAHSSGDPLCNTRGSKRSSRRREPDSLIFDETLHPLNKETHHEREMKEPDFKTIYKFLRNLFSNAQLTAECGVIALVYLERLLTYSELELTPSIWKRILLGAIILASKVWDDQAVWNVDYCQILKEVPVEDVNQLEKEFLEHLQFNINVPSSVYAKYYFELRLLAENNEMLSKSKPLDMKRAKKLDALSRFDNDAFYKNTVANLIKRKCLSAECLPQPGRLSRVVLS